MSEKLDGIRVFWNGTVLISRHNNGIGYPQWFIQGLPKNITLDGELWLGRGTLDLLDGVLSSSNTESMWWKQISFMIFDIPSSQEPYEIRVREMANLQLPDHVCMVNVERCRGNQHLQEYLSQILDGGGEGLMLNKPYSMYVAQRTKNLLKVKVRIHIQTKL
jgi:DNA ligase-1